MDKAHGASKNKIYDSELFIKKSGKLTNIPQKRKENFFHLRIWAHHQKKKFISLCFFSKKFVYSIKDIIKYKLS